MQHKNNEMKRNEKNLNVKCTLFDYTKTRYVCGGM